ncbi:hypothetical protein Tco_0365097 [Tanacetum coccineum]
MDMIDSNNYFLSWKLMVLKYQLRMQIINFSDLCLPSMVIQGASKTSSSAKNVAFVSQSKSSTNEVKSGFTSTYSTYTPSTSSTNTPEKEALAGFADEVIYSLFAKQSEDWDLLHEDLEQIDDLGLEEVDIKLDCYSKGNMMERRRETLFINTKKLEKQEKNQDGIADNG